MMMLRSMFLLRMMRRISLSQEDVFNFLRNNKGKFTALEICNSMVGVSRGTINENLRKLVKNGFVKRGGKGILTDNFRYWV